jgi:hypothetical protein
MSKDEPLVKFKVLRIINGSVSLEISVLSGATTSRLIMRDIPVHGSVKVSIPSVFHGDKVDKISDETRGAIIKAKYKEAA